MRTIVCARSKYVHGMAKRHLPFCMEEEQAVQCKSDTAVLASRQKNPMHTSLVPVTENDLVKACIRLEMEIVFKSCMKKEVYDTPSVPNLLSYLTFL